MSKEPETPTTRKLMAAPFFIAAQLLQLDVAGSSMVNKSDGKGLELLAAGVILVAGGLIYPIPELARNVRRIIVTQIDKFR